jgi:septal ring factor EnvC (AmiA/AmiB activator)
VIVDHGAQAYSLYGQLASIGVEPGTRVDRGQALGTAGRLLAGTPGLYFRAARRRQAGRSLTMA